MRLLPGVPPHVHDQHVLRLERLPSARAPLPRADKGLLAGADVVAIQVANKPLLGAQIAKGTADPVAPS